MSWRYDTHRRCFTTRVDSWRLLIQQGRNKRTWRAAIVPQQTGPARIAPATFTSRTAAQVWCLAALHQEQREGATGS